MSDFSLDEEIPQTYWEEIGIDRRIAVVLSNEETEYAKSYHIHTRLWRIQKICSP